MKALNWIKGLFLLRTENALRRWHPQEPWKWRQDWAEGRVEGSGGGSLVLDEAPVRPGGVLSGRVELPRGKAVSGVVRWRLTAQAMPDPQEEEQMGESLLWQAEVESDGLELAISIPASAVESSRREDGRRVGREWVLEVNAEGFREQFDIPVFNAPGSRASAQQRTTRPVAMDGIRIIRRARGVVIELNRGRHWRVAATGCAWGLALAAMAVVQRLLGAPAVFPVVTGLMALLVGAVSVSGLLEETRIEADADGVTAETSLPGMKGNRQRLERVEVLSVDVRPSGHAGSQMVCEVVARTRWGRNAVLAGGMSRDEGEAVSLAVLESLMSGEDGYTAGTR